jgi:hypothetical protein
VIFAIAVLLVLAAAGAWAARHWPDIQPKLSGSADDAPRQARRDPVAPPAGAAQVADPAVAAPAPVAAPQARAVEPPTTVPAGSAVPAEVQPVAPAEPRAALKLVEAGAAMAQPPPPAHVEPTDPTATAAAAPEPVAALTTPASRARTVADGNSGVSQNRQDLQPARHPSRPGRKVLVQRGDTLMNLAAREYGNANYTVLDVVRGANPRIQDVNRIMAGSELLFPDPGPGSRVQSTDEGVSVLVATTPVLGQAQEFQRMAGLRYRLPADLEPIALGDGRSLYRVSLRQVPDKQQALQIAESLGPILRDPT